MSRQNQQPEKATKVVYSNIRPRVDLIAKIDHYELFVELPGFRKGDITVDMPSHQSIVIEGVITHRFDEERKETEDEVICRLPKYIINERLSGTFSRTIAIPQAINVENIEASFDNGVLHVFLPIKTSQKKKISIL